MWDRDPLPELNWFFKKMRNDLELKLKRVKEWVSSVEGQEVINKNNLLIKEWIKDYRKRAKLDHVQLEKPMTI